MTEASQQRNPLAVSSGYTRLLLQGLTDKEVVEYIEYWTWRRERFHKQSDGFSSWNASKRLSSGAREAARRGLQSEGF